MTPRQMCSVSVVRDHHEDLLACYNDENETYMELP